MPLPLIPLALAGFTGLATAPTAINLYQKSQESAQNRRNILGNTTAPAATVSIPNFATAGNDYDAYSTIQQMFTQPTTSSSSTAATPTVKEESITPTAPADADETAPIVTDLGNGQVKVAYPALNTEEAEAIAANKKELTKEKVTIPAKSTKTTTSTPKVSLEDLVQLSGKPSTNQYDWLNMLLPLIAAGGMGYLLAK